MMGCVYAIEACPYGIFRESCTVGDLCEAIDDTGDVLLISMLRKINYLNNAIDGLFELGFANSEALEWLDAFEKSEMPEKKTSK